MELWPRGQLLDLSKAKELIADCHGLVAGMTPIDREMLLAAPRLRVVTMHGTGTNHIDLDFAKQRGVVVCNVPGGNPTGRGRAGHGPDLFPGPRHPPGQANGLGRRLVPR